MIPSTTSGHAPVAPPCTGSRPADDPHTAWTTDRLSGAEGLTRIAAEWDDLVDRCGTATPFQRSGWLIAWLRHYRPTGEPYVVTVRRDGLLVAGAAVFIERRSGSLVLAPVGRGLSDITEFPADDRHRTAAARRLAAALLALRGWDLLDLPEVRAGSVVSELSRLWPRRVAVTASSVCLEIPHDSVDELLAAGPAPKYLRRRLRRAERAGIDCDAVDLGKLDAGVGTLIDLHRRQWAGRAGNPEHLEPRFRMLLTDALDHLVPEGAAQLDHYRRDGAVVASELLLIGPRSVHTYLIGVDPALREDVDVAALTIRREIDVVARHGRVSLDMLRGDEPYKRRWRTVEIRHERHLLVRVPRPAVVLHVSGVRLRGALRRRIVGCPRLHAELGEILRRLRSDGPVAAARSALTSARELLRPSR